MSTPSAEALNVNSSVSGGEPVAEAPSDSNSNPPASPELAEATPLASTESVDPSLPNPLAFTWLDKNNHSASITFKAIDDAIQWVAYISVACGAHKVPGKWNTYQCTTVVQWGLGLWKAKGLQAIIKLTTPIDDAISTSPVNAFEVGIIALFAEGEAEPAQIVFFAAAATIGDFIEKLKEKGIFVSATSTEIYLTERGKVALADELALELGGAYMPYEPEPPFHIEYIVDFSWPQGNKKDMIFFPTLFTQNAFVCIMTKIRHGHRGRPSGWGIPVNVDNEQDWEYGLQLALYLGGVGEKTGSAENSATLEVSPLPASTGWMLRDAPSSFCEIVFRSPLAAAGFERDAVRFLGAKWKWDDTIGGHGIYLEAPTRISYRLGLVDAKARGGRVKRRVEASKDSELLVLPPCAKFCVMPFSNRQFVFFPSEGIKNAWTARMKVELGATMILGWLRVSDREKQAKGDTIAKEMGGWVVNVPRLKGVSEDGVDSPTAAEDASSQSGDIFTSYIRQAETSRSAALFFHSEEKQQAHAKALLALPGAQQTGEWVDVATVENWTHGVKTAQDFDGALMPINAETSADEEASDSGIVIFPGSLRYAGSTEKLEARWLFPFPADLDKWSNAVLAFPGAKKDGEWIDVQTVEDYDKGFKLAFENGGKPRPDNKPQAAHKQSGINFGPGPVIFPGGLRLNTVTGDPVRQARWLFPLPADLEEWFKAVLELPGAKKGGDEWVDVNTEPEFAKGEELAKKHGGSPWDGKPILEPLVPANTLSLPLPISVLPPVYTSPVFCRNAGSNTDWTMVFSSKSIRDKFILTMLDDHDADWIKGWLEPKRWSTVIELTRDLEGVAVQLPRRFPKDMSKHKFVTDYFQAGSVKGQLLFFRTALQQALFEEILVNCWPKEFKKVNGWVEAADSNSWFDGLAAAKVLGVVVLNMPEDRYIIA